MIEVFKDTKGEWRFRIKAYNGKIIAQSEGYKKKQSCYKGIYALDKVLEDGLDIRDI